MDAVPSTLAKIMIKPVGACVDACSAVDMHRRCNARVLKSGKPILALTMARPPLKQHTYHVINVDSRLQSGSNALTAAVFGSQRQTVSAAAGVDRLNLGQVGSTSFLIVTGTAVLAARSVLAKQQLQ
jgi:hypothetical protein